MILNLKKGSQILGKKIADLDTGEPTQAAPLQQAAQPAPALATLAPAAEPEAPQPGASAPQPSEDWRDLLVRLLVSAPEEVSAQLINCLSSDVLLKALEKKNDPYLKVALMLLTKK